MRVAIRLANPTRISEGIEIADALVDTGATWTVVPRVIADQLNLQILEPISIRTAAGPQSLDQSFVHIDLAGKRMVTPILVSPTLEIVLIGVTTLENMGFAVDPVAGELRESEVYLL